MSFYPLLLHPPLTPQLKSLDRCLDGTNCRMIYDEEQSRLPLIPLLHTDHQHVFVKYFFSKYTGAFFRLGNMPPSLPPPRSDDVTNLARVLIAA